ncbi:MAG: hypothetical protein LBV54_07050 [Puniceicoccales bacterium]|jgi:predicted PurR-regulated permease PerM|nr:hypothetical protein [Puniceicoccales bacterium]
MIKKLFEGSRSLAALFVFTLAAGVVASVSLVLADRRSEQVGRRIQELERTRTLLREDNTRLAETTANFTRQYHLRKDSRVSQTVAWRPTADVIIRVSMSGRRSVVAPNTLSAGTPSRFGVLDIAFSSPGAAAREGSAGGAAR